MSLMYFLNAFCEPDIYSSSPVTVQFIQPYDRHIMSIKFSLQISLDNMAKSTLQ